MTKTRNFVQSKSKCHIYSLYIKRDISERDKKRERKRQPTKKKRLFFKLAQQHNLTVQSLEAANPGVDALNLYIGQIINVPVVDDVPAMSDMVSTLVFASSASKAVTPTSSVVASNDVPAQSDMVTKPVFASSVSATATAIFQPTSDDVPAQSDMVTGPIVYATGAQTAAPTTLATSSRWFRKFFCRTSSAPCPSITIRHRSASWSCIEDFFG